MLIYSSQQVYAFLHEDDTYADPGAIATCWGAFDPLLRAMHLMSRTLSLRHKLLSARSTSPAQSGPGPHLDHQAPVIRGCFETLDDFHAWDEEAGSHWAALFQGRGTPAAPGQVASVAHYDAETACTIILIRTARMILLVSMVAYIDLAEWAPVLENEVEMVIGDMLACVPHALGEVDTAGLSSVAYDGATAVMIHQPMRLLSSCAYTTPEQKRRVDDVLARLNAGIGIRAAAGVSSEDLDRTSWAREQACLRERRAARGQSPGAETCPGSSPDEVETVVGTESPLSLGLDPPWAADVRCASY